MGLKDQEEEERGSHRRGRALECVFGLRTAD